MGGQATCVTGGLSTYKRVSAFIVASAPPRPPSSARPRTTAMRRTPDPPPENPTSPPVWERVQKILGEHSLESPGGHPASRRAPASAHAIQLPAKNRTPNAHIAKAMRLALGLLSCSAPLLLSRL